MTTTKVSIELPAAWANNSTAIMRVYTPDLVLVDEGHAGASLEIPAGTGYLANAVSISGKALGTPQRFDVPEGLPLLTVTLSAPTKERAVASDAASFPVAPVAPREQSHGGPSYVVTQTRVDRGDGSLVFALQPSSLDQIGPRRDLPAGPFWLDTLNFPGPEGARRYAVIPYDVRYGQVRRPQISWSAAYTPELFLPVFDFDDPLFTTLVAALQFGQQAAVRKTARVASSDVAYEAAAEKVSAPLRAALGFLVLLTGEPDSEVRLEAWTANLFRLFPWLPDALPIRVEVLARLGRHKEARLALSELPARGLPWTYRGLRMLVNRLAVYDQTQERGDTQRLRTCQQLLAMAHPACVFCVFEDGTSKSRGRPAVPAPAGNSSAS